MVSLPSISEDRTYDSEADFEEQEYDRRHAEKAALLAAAIFCAWTFQRMNFKSCNIVRPGVKKEIPRLVLRKKISNLCYLVVKEAFSPEYLDSLFPLLFDLFKPQTVTVCV
jgi:hypothetical protein